jgi:hypothetical protein
MSTDNYEFEKAMTTQSIDEGTPYASKNWNYIPDSNNGVYNNNGLTQLYIDLSNLYNSTKYTNSEDMFLAFPITMVAALFYINNNNSIAEFTPLNKNFLSNLLSLKPNHCNLINKADLTINGKLIEQQQDFLNKYIEFKMLSEMNTTDLKQYGYTLGLGDNVENHQSVRYNKTSSSQYYKGNGNGITNNIFYNPIMATNKVTQSNLYGQKSFNVNDNLKKRVNKYVDTNFTPTVLWDGLSQLELLNQLNMEAMPSVQYIDNKIIYNDVCIIRLKDIFESLNNIGLVKRIDGVLRLFINTGTCGISINGANDSAPDNVSDLNVNGKNIVYNFNYASSNFTNGLPFTINYINEPTATSPFYNTGGNYAVSMLAGLYIGNTPSASVSVNGYNLSITSGLGLNILKQVRLYFSQIEIDYKKEGIYSMKNRNKKVVYRTIQYVGDNNINGNYSKLIASGIKNPVSLLIFPFIAQNEPNGFNTNKVPGWASPFDTNLAHPISLQNLQCQLGGLNVLQGSPLFYTFENFMEQVQSFENMSGSDLGVLSAGLYNEEWWKVNRVYLINLDRNNMADRLTPRNLTVSFNVASQCSVDLIYILVYRDEFEIDCETGIIKK